MRRKANLAGIGGTQWFNDEWGLSYTGSWRKQGRTSNRRGIVVLLRRKL